MQIEAIDQKQDSLLTIVTFDKGSEPQDQDYFRADKGEIWWTGTDELWLGLGANPKLPELIKTFRMLFHKGKERWPQKLMLDGRGKSAAWIEMAVNGIILGGYDMQLYKTEPKKYSSFFGEEGQLFILVDTLSDEIINKIVTAQITADVQLKVMDLMNAPGNKKQPEMLAEWAKKSGLMYGYQVDILEKDRLEKEGMHALLAVSKGSSAPPVMIVMEYKPATFEKTIALVGKGVTFDTGGISIKSSANMHLMKSDMGGAAAVLGAIELVARLKLPIHVVGIIPSTENCIDGNATKPGDVIDSYAGKTIEVIDTDAEGRLILADGLSYAVKNFNPDTLIDLATLTGSVVQTLGYVAAGLFTANDELANALQDAGNITGEKLWRLPIWDDYLEEIASDIADVKNYHGKPLAGAIVAAKFLEVFTDKHAKWAHLDIAGTAFGDAEFAPGRSGTAYGVRLLTQYLSQACIGN